ncbi:holo-ACP synthase [Luteimicrobium xylanilyticum]|uniref:holo-ACP synthase n=1 Tax=Luteimicrobium xylanilyticum TaxID=1133546 RepID=UPI000560326F|nr:4'-phosphopantetheinyl transferase superfamily protein [Luteimicrobium xylanilyticum]
MSSRWTLEVRVGIDAQPVSEVIAALEQHGDAYRRRLFTDHEVRSSGGWGADAATSAPRLAARFAAKEAVLKVLRPDTVVPGWREIEVVRMPAGWCRIVLSGRAERLAEAAGLTEFDVSLSHTVDLAVAAVVAA